MFKKKNHDSELSLFYNQLENMLIVMYDVMYSFPWTGPQNNSKQQTPAHRTARHDTQELPDKMYSSKLLTYYTTFIMEE